MRKTKEKTISPFIRLKIQPISLGQSSDFLFKFSAIWHQSSKLQVENKYREETTIIIMFQTIDFLFRHNLEGKELFAQLFFSQSILADRYFQRRVVTGIIRKPIHSEIYNKHFLISSTVMEVS